MVAASHNLGIARKTKIHSPSEYLERSKNIMGSAIGDDKMEYVD